MEQVDLSPACSAHLLTRLARPRIFTLPFHPYQVYRPPARPIVSLEDFDHLLAAVICDQRKHHEGTTITLSFTSPGACADALESWSTQSTFTLVTLHPTCNLADQRGAWQIKNVEGLPESQEITLDASALPLREVGHSFHISHNPGGLPSARGYLPQHGRRQLGDEVPHGFVQSFGHDFNFSTREQVFPPNDALNALSQRDNIADEPPLASVSIPDPTFEVFCIDCVSRANFSVGIEMDVTNSIDVANAHINFTVLDFEHKIQLEFSATDSLTIQESQDVVKVPFPDLGFDIPGVGSFGLFWGVHLGADFEVVGGLNFSIGAEASIPSGAVATLVLLNSGSFSASAALTLSPFLEVDVTFAEANVLRGRIDINTPQIVANAAVLANVNRQCQAVGASDFESFTAALTFGAGAAIGIDVNVTSMVVPNLETVQLFTDNFTFSNLPSPNAPGCFIIAADGTSVGNAGNTNPNGGQGLVGLVPAPTGTLLTAAEAVPTFDLPKIESYYSANAALPTNVNYTQLVEATPVPTDIQAAVNQIIGNSKGNGGGGGGSKSGGQFNGPTGWSVLVLLATLTALAGI
ncbi:hypothetical protein K438DRAFT_1976744 [Mycena galopus ATCC 62051]|nr:hypothetical protein K438DRAFT_1976744 [Mycena galopus ATCC 62051]